MSGQFLEAASNCTVCYDVYTNPKRLKCGHVFCGTCVDTLINRSAIKCPVCRQFGTVFDVKPDLQTSYFLDAIKDQKKFDAFRQKEAAREETKMLCGFCKFHCITSKCETCDAWMCHTCRTAHAKIIPTQTHTVYELKHYAKPVRSQLRVLHDEIHDMVVAHEDARSIIEYGISTVVRARDVALQECKQNRERAKTMVDCRYNRIEKKIKTRCQPVIDKLCGQEKESLKRVGELLHVGDQIERDFSKVAKLALDGEDIVKERGDSISSVKLPEEVKMTLPMVRITGERFPKWGPRNVPPMVVIEAKKKRYFHILHMSMQDMMPDETVTGSAAIHSLVEAIAQQIGANVADLLQVEVKIDGKYVKLDVPTFHEIRRELKAGRDNPILRIIQADYVFAK